VLEALLLENVLIKKHQPPFNAKEKDNKTYTCVVITKEDYPRVLTMRLREYEKRFVADGSIEKVDKVYGPFSSASQIKEALRIIRKMFPFRDRCELHQSKPCFNASIKLCPGTCVGMISKEEYKSTIKNIKNLFEGKRETIIKDLEKQMNQYSKSMEFEKAARVRNTLFALDHIKDVSLIKNEDVLDFKNKNFRIEAYDVAHISGSGRVGVMTVVINGKKATDEYRKFKLDEKVNDDYQGIRDMIMRRMSHMEWGVPDLIVFDGS
jgi:excinuclease ABC subunit C